MFSYCCHILDLYNYSPQDKHIQLDQYDVGYSNYDTDISSTDNFVNLGIIFYKLISICIHDKITNALKKRNISTDKCP